jgi:hypothetical protein
MLTKLSREGEEKFPEEIKILRQFYFKEMKENERRRFERVQ